MPLSMTASTGSAVGTPPTAPNVPFTRKDGRTPSQLRPLSYEQSLLHRADGSIRYSQGNTTLLVAVYGPTLASHREEQWERAVLVFTFSSTSATATVASASSTFSSAALCHHLHAAFTPIVLLSLHPRHRISVHIQLLSDDGGVLVAAVNATMLALMDAGIQCREMIAAVELRVRHDNTATGDKKAAVLLDPNKEETEVGSHSTAQPPWSTQYNCHSGAAWLTDTVLPLLVVLRAVSESGRRCNVCFSQPMSAQRPPPIPSIPTVTCRSLTHADACLFFRVLQLAVLC